MKQHMPYIMKYYGVAIACFIITTWQEGPFSWAKFFCFAVGPSTCLLQDLLELWIELRRR